LSVDNISCSVKNWEKRRIVLASLEDRLLGSRSDRLPPCHLLCHQQHHSQVTFFHAAGQTAEFGKQASVFARAAPQNVIDSFALGYPSESFESITHRMLGAKGLPTQL
jgi:hypothetical protein